MHKNHGKCNADELCKILKKESPEVIFLEALENTYSKHDRSMFSSFGVYHQKLEIEAIQKYSHYATFEYVPLLDNGLSNLFNEKYERVCKNSQLQEMIDEFNLLAMSKGFQFLNSQRSMDLHQKMRTFEDFLLQNTKLNEIVIEEINTYENTMMQNIYSYCTINPFGKAVFMCGSAHRKSLIKKIKDFKDKENMDLNWAVYSN